MDELLSGVTCDQLLVHQIGTSIRILNENPDLLYVVAVCGVVVVPAVI